MSKVKVKVRKRAPLLLHVAFFVCLVGPPLIAGYVPLRRKFSDPDSFLLVWPIFFLIWMPIFLWMLCETTKRDILLAAFAPVLAIFLLWSSGNLATALVSGLFAALGFDLN